MAYPNTIGTGDAEILDSGIARVAVNAVVVACVLTALALVLTFFRFQMRMKAGWGLDDTILAISLPFVIIQLIAQFFLAFWAGEGWLMQDMMVYPWKITRTLQLIYWPSFNYGIVTALIKTSILFSYKRIFGHMKKVRWAIWILLFLTWGWCMSNIFGMAFQCTPIRKAWHPEIDGKCIDLIAFLWGNSVSNFMIDWLILAVPIGPVFKLQLPLPKKILVGLAFLCGSLACIASTIRSSHTGDFDPMDLGRSVYTASIWIYIEPPMGIISCCLPFLSRIWGDRAMKRVKALTSRMGSGQAGSKGTSTNASNNRSSFMALSSAQRGASGDWDEHHRAEEGNILRTTTTRIHGQPATESTELRPYDFTVKGGTRTTRTTRTESRDSLV